MRGLSSGEAAAAARQGAMRPDFSAFLDLLRLSAAAVVFLGHLSWAHFGGEALSVFEPLAHSAVATFFVLSGYVIAWAARRDGGALGLRGEPGGADLQHGAAGAGAHLRARRFDREHVLPALSSLGNTCRSS